MAFGWGLGLKSKHKKTIAAEREARKEKYRKEAEERTMEFENQQSMKTQEEIKKAETEHKTEMKKAQDLGNRKLEEIEKEKACGNFYLIEKIERMQEVNKEELTQQINEITENTKPQLEECRQRENEAISQMLSGQSGLESAFQERRIVQQKQLHEKLDLWRKLNEERRQIEEQNLVEVMDFTEQICIEEQETERAVSRMTMEHLEEKKQRDLEIQSTQISRQQCLLNAQSTCLINEKLKKLNKEIKEMHHISFVVKNCFDSCIQYLGDDFEWNTLYFQRAKDKFKILDNKIQDLAIHMNQLSLRNITRENDRIEMTTKVQEAMNLQGKLKTCAAKFSGCMMNQRRGWKAEDVTMLEQLNLELGEKINSIQTLDSLETEIRTHLQGISTFQFTAIQ